MFSLRLPSEKRDPSQEIVSDVWVRFASVEMACLNLILPSQPFSHRNASPSVSGSISGTSSTDVSFVTLLVRPPPLSVQRMDGKKRPPFNTIFDTMIFDVCRVAIAMKVPPTSFPLDKRATKQGHEMFKL